MGQQPYNFSRAISSHDNRRQTFGPSLKCFLLADLRLYSNLTYNLFFRLWEHFIVSKSSIKLASVVITSRPDLRTIEANEVCLSLRNIPLDPQPIL
jgi:hypothetical protein